MRLAGETSTGVSRQISTPGNSAGSDRLRISLIAFTAGTTIDWFVKSEPAGFGGESLLKRMSHPLETHMLAGKIKIVQSAVALALFACMLSPFVEFLLHGSGSIFISGHDTESTVAVLLLLIELSVAMAAMLVAALRTVLEKLGVVLCSNRIAAAFLIFSKAIPTISPPVPLRI